MAEHIKIRKAGGTWVMRACGAIMGETTRALELSEGDYPPVLYIPREDIAMAFFERSDSKTHCPHKGDAGYFTIQGPSETIIDAAWSYENPLEPVAAIKDHLAFYTGKVELEQL